jgi:hypothetical protein
MELRYFRVGSRQEGVEAMEETDQWIQSFKKVVALHSEEKRREVPRPQRGSGGESGVRRGVWRGVAMDTGR